eukprot:CAMPEP_0168455502 /NCGR_PEP_ID=MMETSP0228-20121227/50783_1 /TAXON_ID=133427 /ORGANISM="Protoceratium reticulatum, Strain CCCM 535 (=CCMP 1889)" /LENGTH=174 /DNA_ID=CAMNT_0008470349 /DNA_START=145 /DNA_END=669 /DNA_ORIENTATION=+
MSSAVESKPHSPSTLSSRSSGMKSTGSLCFGPAVPTALNSHGLSFERTHMDAVRPSSLHIVFLTVPTVAFRGWRASQMSPCCSLSMPPRRKTSTFSHWSSVASTRAGPESPKPGPCTNAQASPSESWAHLPPLGPVHTRPVQRIKAPSGSLAFLICVESGFLPRFQKSTGVAHL